MHSFTATRLAGRQLRSRLGEQPEGLLDRLLAYIRATYQLDICAVPASAIEEGLAEIRPDDGCLLYDERLDQDLPEKLRVLAHELAHLERHGRLTHRNTALDAIFGSIYVTEVGSALARYSPRSLEEVEANIYAREFLCPADEIFKLWCEHPDATAQSFASAHQLPVDLVRIQLTEGLYTYTVGPDLQQLSKPEATLNESQHEAARYTEGPALVNAGPGTGKTATLVHRVGLALNQWEADPQSLLILTFSNEAADELRARIGAKFGDDRAAQIEIATFHGFGASFLRKHGHLVGVDPKASVIDEAVQVEIVTAALGSISCDPILNLKDPSITADLVVRHINYLKDRLITPDQLAAALDASELTGSDADERAKERAFLALYREYEVRKLARKSVDFGDLIMLPLQALQNTGALREQLRRQYRWVLVDEYQDVSRAVAFLLQQLAGPDNPPWAVGDLRQAIYLFRGASMENVLRFNTDFEGARQFDLDTNYRSCDVVVEVANQLASLMAEGLDSSTATSESVETGVESPATPLNATAGWKVGRTVPPVGNCPVVLARATSDRAEYDGITTQVRQWLEVGVDPTSIAVLARRNIDVRNIVLALGERGIRSITAGLVTPEGAAGDLAVVLTLADNPRASLPRVTYGLAGGRYSAEVVNAAVHILLASYRGSPDTTGAPGQTETQSLITSVSKLVDAVRDEQYSADAFSMLSLFLFDGSDYLRNIMATSDDTTRTLALSEIVTTLSLAAAYRFCHEGVAPHDARLGFADYFRRKLLSSLPALVPPKATADAIRVMTCHASKGLEFPCVIVAGQTLSQVRGEAYPWIPAALRPRREHDLAQADSLFFVGLTRAEQAVVVSYAESRSGSTRSPRDITPLLVRWRDRFDVPTMDWIGAMPDPEVVVMSAVWGNTPDITVGVHALKAKACTIKTYLEDDVGIRFPMLERPLYPIFIGRIRRALQELVRQSHKMGARLTESDAIALFESVWPVDDELKSHPHLAIYRPRAMTAAKAFASIFIPSTDHIEILDASAVLVPVDGAPGVRLDLIGYYRHDDGNIFALQLENESLLGAARQDGILWSGLKPYRRLPFVLLWRKHGHHLSPHVFSVADERIYPFQWAKVTARGNSMEKEAATVSEVLAMFANQRYETTINEWNCDQCGVRVSCPYWMQAIHEDSVAATHVT